MKDYDVIVIGAGNGGLTAAASLVNKGKKVLLLERHNIPGGCSSARRPEANLIFRARHK